jgi:hypothetical protein
MEGRNSRECSPPPRASKGKWRKNLACQSFIATDIDWRRSKIDNEHEHDWGWERGLG